MLDCDFAGRLINFRDHTTGVSAILLCNHWQHRNDKTKRNDLIKEAFKIHADDIGHLPLHQQSLAWGVSKKVELTQLADNFMFFKWMSIKAQQQP